MSNTVPHTVLRNGTYHFKMRVRAALRAVPEYAHIDFIQFSLRTKDKTIALKRVGEEIRKIEASIAMQSRVVAAASLAKNASSNTPVRSLNLDGVSVIVGQYEEEFFRDHPINEDQELEATQWDTEFGYVGGQPLEHWRQRKALLLDPNRRAKFEFDERIIEFADEALDLGAYKLSDETWITLLQSLTAIEIKCIDRLLEVNKARETGGELVPLSLAPAHRVITVSQVVQHYIDHYPNRKALVSKLAPALRAWSELTTIDNVESIKQKHIRAFTRDLEKLPARYSRRFPGVPLREIMKINAALPEPFDLLAEKTIREGYVGPLNSAFSAAASDELVATNPFKGVRLSDVGRRTEDKRPFRTHELNLLFQHPIWTGCHSGERRNTPGQHIIKDEYYWAPLLALFTGLRADEIAELQIEDIRARRQLPHIKVAGTKTENAVRSVPLHTALVELGFLDHIDAMAAVGSQSLFPGWKVPQGKTKSAGACQRNFNERIVKRGDFDNPKPTFHSFRQTLRSEMENNNLSIGYQRVVMGHSQQGMDKHYFNPDLEEYHAKFIDAVRFKSVDLSHLKSARSA